jgi:hypothetical protein
MNWNRLQWYPSQHYSSILHTLWNELFKPDIRRSKPKNENMPTVALRSTYSQNLIQFFSQLGHGVRFLNEAGQSLTHEPMSYILFIVST